MNASRHLATSVYLQCATLFIYDFILQYNDSAQNRWKHWLVQYIAPRSKNQSLFGGKVFNGSLNVTKHNLCFHQKYRELLVPEIT